MSQTIPVEIITLDPYRVIARGFISPEKQRELGLPSCPDNVIRITDMAGSQMCKEMFKQYGIYEYLNKQGEKILIAQAIY
jgi:hypothetical protein